MGFLFLHINDKMYLLNLKEMVILMNYVGWLIVFVVFAALELTTMGLTCVWFAVGALAGCVASLLGGNWIVQALVFIIVTVIVLIFVRPFALKFINNNAEKTNVDSMEGKTGKVLATIDNVNATGLIMVDGMEWTARSADGDVIPKDELVTVVSVEGVKAIVKKHN